MKESADGHRAVQHSVRCSTGWASWSRHMIFLTAWWSILTRRASSSFPPLEGGLMPRQERRRSAWLDRMTRGRSLVRLRCSPDKACWTARKRSLTFCGVMATGVPLSSADGQMGPLQLIFQGKTERSICDIKSVIEQERFDGWHFTFSNNHWSNLDTMKDFVTKLLVPW